MVPAGVTRALRWSTYYSCDSGPEHRDLVLYPGYRSRVPTTRTERGVRCALIPGKPHGLVREGHVTGECCGGSTALGPTAVGCGRLVEEREP